MKYTVSELEEMALDFLYMSGKGDPRTDVLVQSLSHYFRTNPDSVMHQIRILARGEDI